MVADYCKQLYIMHRIRVLEATTIYPDSVMSGIIDSASQNHCKIPHGGTDTEFAGLEQHLEG